jgi:hypothetical protein
MMKIIVFVFSLTAALNVIAQPPPTNQYERDQQQVRGENSRSRETDNNKPLDFLNVPNPNKGLVKNKIPLKLQEKLKITDADKALIADLPNNKKLKIVKLWNDECGDNKIVDADDEKCVEQGEYSIASHFSFYLNGYTDKFVSIALLNGKFSVDNNPEWTQILVDLGQPLFAQVDTKSIAVEKLKQFHFPDAEKEEMQKELKRGVSYKGLKLSDSVNLLSNHTYLVSSVFEDLDLIGRTKKKALIYTFQVVKQDANIVTIVWKEVK